MGAKLTNSPTVDFVRNVRDLQWFLEALDFSLALPARWFRDLGCTPFADIVVAGLHWWL